MSSEAPDPVQNKILVVDDDEQILSQIRWALADSYEVLTAGDRKQALEVLHREEILVVLLDLGLPPHPRDADEGLLALDEILSMRPRAKVIVVSGNSDRDNAVLAVHKGAFDFFPKPIDVEQLEVVLDRVFRRLDLEMVAPAVDATTGEPAFEAFLGTHPKIRSVIDDVKKVAPADVPVLITGETGTGKEKIALAIHEISGRRAAPFVAINCGAIPANLLESELFGYEAGAFTGATKRRKGRIELAQEGTLFLDEIGELGAGMQVKLLRFLQEKIIERVGGRDSIAIDCRVVAASHLDFRRAIEEKKFREDLYFRLAVVEIHLPPLRERGDDVIQLAEHFLQTYSQQLEKPTKSLSADAREAVLIYPWTGNVRELQNRVHQAVIFSENSRITASDLKLDASVQAATPIHSLKAAREELEIQMVRQALRENQGNISKTARILGISRPTLYDLMEKHGLKP